MLRSINAYLDFLQGPVTQGKKELGVTLKPAHGPGNYPREWVQQY